MKSKGDFIIDLLASKKISEKNRERILKLSAKEFEKNDHEYLRILTEIEGLKNIYEMEQASISNKLDNVLEIINGGSKALFIKSQNIDTVHSSIKEIINQESIKIIPETEKAENLNNQFSEIESWKIPNPKHVADFMSLFNKRDGLKYLTHDFDEESEFQIDKFLLHAHSVFTEKTLVLKIPKSLWTIVEQFAFRGKEQPDWSSISEDYKQSIILNIGWASKDLRQWSKLNKLHPIRNTEYEKVITHFKRITRIKEPDLEKLINTTLEKVFSNDLKLFTISKNQLKKADFYTHVVLLKTALESIFEMIKEESNRNGSKQINIEYERGETNDGYYFRKIIITHLNSFPTKELELVCREWKEKGSMGKVKNKLNGYCHWSVETIIDQIPTRVNLLKEDKTPEYELNVGNSDGFTYLLTFYYK